MAAPFTGATWFHGAFSPHGFTEIQAQWPVLSRAGWAQKTEESWKNGGDLNKRRGSQIYASGECPLFPGPVAFWAPPRLMMAIPVPSLLVNNPLPSTSPHFNSCCLGWAHFLSEVTSLQCPLCQHQAIGHWGLCMWDPLGQSGAR